MFDYDTTEYGARLAAMAYNDTLGAFVALKSLSNPDGKLVAFESTYNETLTDWWPHHLVSAEDSVRDVTHKCLNAPTEPWCRECREYGHTYHDHDSDTALDFDYLVRLFP